MQKKYGTFPVSSKLFLATFGMTLVLIVVVWNTIYKNYAQVLKDNEIKYNLLASDKTKSQFDFTITLIQNTTATLAANADIQAELNRVYDTGLDVEENPQVREEIELLLNSVLEMQSYIMDIHVITLSENVVFSSFPGVDVRGLYNTYGAYFNRAIQEDQSEFWLGGYDRTMSYIQPIYHLNPRAVMGLIVININYDFVREMFMASAIQANERILIVNSEGQIIFNFPHFTSYTPFLESHPEILIPDHLQMEGKVFGQDSIIVSETINMADWKIIRLIDMESITAETSRVSRLLRLVLMASAVTSLFCSLTLARLITKPIRRLRDACQRVEQGDLTTRVEIRSRDEMGNLGRTFNMMIAQLRESFEKEMQDQQRKAEMQFQILQAQINPHFLYNTLDSIKWMAVMQNANNIAEMSTSLIHLLKYNLAQPDANTTLQDEVESVKNYVRIQKFRYSDNFDLTTRLDPETLHCKVLRFMLQPLVENSILHGFDNLDARYQISIASFFSDDCLHIKVIDNGSGMNPEQTRQINEGWDKGTRFNKNIGIQNIRERIQLHFGKEYGLTYSSEPYVGTIAELILPVIPGDDSPMEEKGEILS
ncbi:MAG: sensor histidine kinase [Oscillospiraceae bacterium]